MLMHYSLMIANYKLLNSDSRYRGKEADYLPIHIYMHTNAHSNEHKLDNTLPLLRLFSKSLIIRNKEYWKELPVLS
jgi:hypothetical protein